MTDEPPAAVTLYSTWRGIATSFLSAAALTFLGVFGIVASGGFPIIAVLLLVTGLTLSWVALFDYPHRAIFDGQGIVRCALLRRQRLPWDTVTAVRRSRGSRVGNIRPEGTGRLSISLGGLVATCGARRRYLLVNHVESLDEFTEVKAIITRAAPGAFVAQEPPPGVTPTWLYHERRR